MLALLFPGQGSQEVGMGRDLAAQSPSARQIFERADEVLGLGLSKLCFEGPADALTPTAIQQPAILTTSVALLRALEDRYELRPSFLMGHSLGEYSALVAGGAIEFEDAVRLVHARGRFMQEAVRPGRGAMAAVMGCKAEQVEEACANAEASGDGIVRPANYNGPAQTVIAGDAGAVLRAGEEAKRLGAKRAVPLAVSAPFHCPLMEPAAAALDEELGQISWRDLDVPVMGNVEAAPYREAARIPGLLRAQVTAPVRFTESVSALVSAGVDRVLEVGPGAVLGGLVARIERRLPRASVSDAESLAAAGDFLAEGAR